MTCRDYGRVTPVLLISRVASPEQREHMAIRFRNGQPDSLWYSQHATGQAFTYRAAEKEGKRVGSDSGSTAPWRRFADAVLSVAANRLLLERVSCDLCHDRVLSPVLLCFSPQESLLDQVIDHIAPPQAPRSHDSQLQPPVRSLVGLLRPRHPLGSAPQLIPIRVRRRAIPSRRWDYPSHGLPALQRPLGRQAVPGLGPAPAQGPGHWPNRQVRRRADRSPQQAARPAQHLPGQCQSVLGPTILDTLMVQWYGQPGQFEVVIRTASTHRNFCFPAFHLTRHDATNQSFFSFSSTEQLELIATIVIDIKNTHSLSLASLVP